jgi:hypothetical protein
MPSSWTTAFVLFESLAITHTRQNTRQRHALSSARAKAEAQGVGNATMWSAESMRPSTDWSLQRRQPRAEDRAR